MRGVLACPASPFSESPKHLWLSQGLAGWVAHVPGDQHWDDGRSQVGNISSFALPLLDSEQLESLVWWHCGSAQAGKCVRTHFTFGRSGAISWLFPCCVPLLRVRRCPKLKGVNNHSNRDVPSHRAAGWTCESCELACAKPAGAVGFCADCQQPCDSKMEMLSAAHMQYLYGLTLAFDSEFLSLYSK